MYLIEIKWDDIIIRKYVQDAEHLGRLITEELPRYEYIKILKGIKDGVLIESQKKDNNLPKHR